MPRDFSMPIHCKTYTRKSRDEFYLEIKFWQEKSIEIGVPPVFFSVEWGRLLKGVHMKFLIANMLFLLAFNAFSSEKWAINRHHSEIVFKVPYMSLSEVSGRFQMFRGSMDYERNKDEFNNVSIDIDVSSIFTGNKMRDEHLRENDFFAVGTYPTITFKSKSIVEKNGELKVVGDMTIHGVTKEVIFTGKKTPLEKDTWGYENIFVGLQTDLQREDFGLVWNKTLEASGYLVGKTVRVNVTFQIQPLARMTPFSKHKIPDTKTIRLREQYARGEISLEKYKELSGEKTAYEVIVDTEDKPVKEVELLKENDRPKAIIAEAQSHKENYQQFSKNGPLYYLSSIALGILALFGTVSSFVFVARKFSNVGLKYTLQGVIVVIFSLAFYIVVFDDFMALTTSLFQ